MNWQSRWVLARRNLQLELWREIGAVQAFPRRLDTERPGGAGNPSRTSHCSRPYVQVTQTLAAAGLKLTRSGCGTRLMRWVQGESSGRHLAVLARPQGPPLLRVLQPIGLTTGQCDSV